jgi:hypothetical protein
LKSVATTVLVALVSAFAAGCGTSDAEHRGSQRGRLVDTTRGAFGGVRLGDTPAEVRRRFGSKRCVRNGDALPLGEDEFDVGAPGGWGYRPRNPDGPSFNCVMRYDDVAVVVTPPDGVTAFVITLDGARTDGGVVMGDTPSDVKRHYPDAYCEEEIDEVPASCTAPVRGARELYFGLHERAVRAAVVGSIWFGATSRQGLYR